MSTFQYVEVPARGAKIAINADYSLSVPDHPIMPGSPHRLEVPRRMTAARGLVDERQRRRWRRLASHEGETLAVQAFPQTPQGGPIPPQPRGSRRLPQ